MSSSQPVWATLLPAVFAALVGGTVRGQPGMEAPRAIAFEYGIVGRTESRPDSLFPVQDGGSLRSGDEIRITVRMMLNTCLYVVLHMSNGGYMLFHAAPRVAASDETVESLRWLRLDDATGVETVHLVASAEPLIRLEQALEDYGAARGARRAALAAEVASQLPQGPEAGASEALLPLARLDTRAPLGWNYRGPYDEGEKSRYLFTRCAGDSIAADHVRIIHER